MTRARVSSPCGNRTRLPGLRGRCPCRSTNGLSSGVRRAGVEPAKPGGGWVTATWARQCPADAFDPDPIAREGVDPSLRPGPGRSVVNQRKGRESNPQGSSLARVRVGCRLRSACPSVLAAPGAGIEPANSSLTERRMNQLMQPRYGFPSGRPDSNRRSPGPEPGGFAMLSHAPKPQSAQRESNPHFRHGEAAGYRYIMGTIADAELSMKPRAPSGTRTHVAALRVRCPRRWTTGAESERDRRGATLTAPIKSRMGLLPRTSPYRRSSRPGRSRTSA